MAIATGFAITALTIVALQVVNHYGYTSVRGILLLLVVAALAAVTIGMNSAIAIALALVVYFILREILAGDWLAVTVILGALAVVAALSTGVRRPWRW